MRLTARTVWRNATTPSQSSFRRKPFQVYCPTLADYETQPIECRLPSLVDGFLHVYRNPRTNNRATTHVRSQDPEGCYALHCQERRCTQVNFSHRAGGCAAIGNRNGDGN